VLLQKLSAPFQLDKRGHHQHIHPLQDEIFEVIEGKLELSAKGK
jgi:quercetin dioxygenase-like cupin family protein